MSSVKKFVLCILNCDFIGAGRRWEDNITICLRDYTIMEVVGDWGKLADLFRGPH